MSKVQDQISALSRLLYEQHQAEKTPLRVERSVVTFETEEGAEEVTVQRTTTPYSRPLPPGQHPMMAPRFIPGAVETRQSVHSRGAAMDVVKRVFDDAPDPFPWDEVVEDETPSIEAAPVKKKFSRKLEP